MKCKHSGCTCHVMISAVYCWRHGGPARARHEAKDAQREHRQRFDASGRVRPGQGLSRLSREDAKRWAEAYAAA